VAYDYKQRIRVVNEMLNSSTEISNSTNISEISNETDGRLTYENGIKGWVTSIFIDIVKSSALFRDSKPKMVSKIIRVFSSEVIQILNDTKLFRKIGLRGDCVYGIFATPNVKDVHEVYEMAVQINTLKRMINERFIKSGFKSINYGIGVGCSEDLVIKVGRKKIVNDLVFIGKSVINAANLSGIAARNGIKDIAIDETVYENIREMETSRNNQWDNWVKYSSNTDIGMNYYHFNLVNVEFNNWIDKV